MGKKDESSTYMATKMIGRHHRSLFEIAALIEQYSLCEKKAGDIPEEAVTKVNLISFYEVGARHGFATAIPLIITVPFSFMVADKLLHVFGKATFSWQDAIFCFFLSVLPAVATSLFLFLFIFSPLYQGNITGKCMRALANGIVLGKTVGCAIAFVLFHVVYYAVLQNPKVYQWILTKLTMGNIIKPHVAYRIAEFLLSVKDDFIKSAWFVVGVLALNLLMIYGGLELGKKKTEKFIEFKKSWLLD